MEPFQYMYGVVDCRTGLPEDMGTGVSGAPVVLVRRGNLAALCSQIASDNIIPARAEVLAHQKVLERAMQQATVLPVAFGTVTRDRTGIHEFLDRIAGEATQLCDLIQGRVELGLKMFWLPEAVRQAIESDLGNPLSEQRSSSAAVEVGRAVADVVQRWKDSYAQEIVDALRPLAVAVRDNPPINLQMLANVSFLVDKERAAAFEARVYELDRAYSDRMNLRLATGLPPYNFVDLRVSM